MKTLILAGGFATRLYPITINRAKALLEFQGMPVISHIINKIPADIPILVSTNKKFESDFLIWRNEFERPIKICVEEATSDDQKKGAVGAIDFWIKSLPIAEDLLVIAGDNYFEMDIRGMISRFNGKDPIIAVRDVGDKETACEIGTACQVGLVILEGNTVVRLDEKPAQATSSIVSTGIYILPRLSFASLSRYCREGRRDNMGSLITYFLENKKKVSAYVFTEKWMDIGDEIKRGRISL
jgi:glucose-1-phosphate thymidylyltransferase